MKNKFTLQADYSRKYPDPINQLTSDEHNDIEHHILLCRANKLPSGISLDPNPREQKTDYGIYRKVKESLENPDEPSFHLKNKGITILANKVDISDDKKSFDVYLGEHGGIVDGGHTYKIILTSQEEGNCPESQYVRIEIITGVSRELGIEIAGGLNTAVQVQEASLLNLDTKFKWFKDLIEGESYADDIAYKQNVDKAYDVRDILALLTVFNVKHFDAKTHPKMAYTSKANCLELYKKDQESFEMLTPIVKDILKLHDYVHTKSNEIYNAQKRKEGGKGRAAGMTGVFETRNRGEYSFPFTKTKSKERLYAGSFFPIMGSLRFLVEHDKKSNVYRWKIGSFESIKKFYDEVAPEMISTTYNTSLVYGRKPTAVGKDDNLWENLYKTVALHYLEDYHNS